MNKGKYIYVYMSIWSEGKKGDKRCASQDRTNVLLDHVQRPPPHQGGSTVQDVVVQNPFFFVLNQSC